jgi:hypothetical protein
MLIRVTTKDVQSAKLLAADLAGLFGDASVTLQPDGEVLVEPHQESNRALVRTLEAVEGWLERMRIASAAVSVGGRSYTLEHPQPLPSG